MTEIADVSEVLIRPVAMAVDDRAKFVTKALVDAINGAEYYLLNRLTVEAINLAMVQMQVLNKIQHEELLRLAIDGAEVDPDILGGMDAETVQ